jgi:hypothetical protein
MSVTNEVMVRFKRSRSFRLSTNALLDLSTIGDTWYLSVDRASLVALAHICGLKLV